MTLLRAAVMTPYLREDGIFASYSEAVKAVMQKKLEQIIEHEGSAVGA